MFHYYVLLLFTALGVHILHTRESSLSLSQRIEAHYIALLSEQRVASDPVSPSCTQSPRLNPAARPFIPGVGIAKRSYSANHPLLLPFFLNNTNKR